MSAIASSKTYPEDRGTLVTLIENQASEIESLKHERDLLKHYILQLRKQHYGPKSERIHEDQQVFQFYGTVDLAKPEPAEEEKTGPSPERKRPSGRKVIPPDLPRKVILHDVPEDAKTCGGCKIALAKIGEETSERLEFQRAQLYVIQDVRPKYACAHGCRKEGVVVADPPAQVIPKAKVGPGLLAHILWSKYGLHLPLYRQEIMFGRIGLEIPRSTMCAWIDRCVELLKPIYEAMKRDVLASEVIFSDDTPVRLLDPGMGKTRQARTWSYVGDLLHRQIVYEFTESREQEWPQKFLKEFKGVLQVDGYAGYNALFDLGRILAAYCWAHARRKLLEAEDSDKERSKIAVAFIGQLYGIERDIRGQAPKRKKRVRRSRAAKILRRFKKWLDQEIQNVLPKSPIGQAIQYARGHWEGLLTYTKNGAVEIDTNRVERTMRGWKLGLKNWLFLGSEDGGTWGAVLYSLIETCKLLGINPETYLSDVLVRISTTPMSQVDSLMPRLWRPPPVNTS